MLTQAFAAGIGAAIAAFVFSKLSPRGQAIASLICVVFGVLVVAYAVWIIGQ